MQNGKPEVYRVVHTCRGCGKHLLTLYPGGGRMEAADKTDAGYFCHQCSQDHREPIGEPEPASHAKGMPIRSKENVECTEMPRILVADDNPETKDFYRIYFEMNGFQVECVDNGKDLLAEGIANPYDLIVSDIHMPSGHGDTIASALRGAGIRTPVLFVTAYAEDAQVPEGTPLLTKPIDIHVLLDKVDEILGIHRDTPEQTSE